MALTKAQALALSEPVEKMYMDCASQLIINISKHFATGRGLATQAWEAQKLAEMGQLTDEAIEIIAVNTGQKAEEVRKALYDGIKTGLADEEALLQNAAEKGYVATAGGTLETSMQVRNLVDAYAAQADDQLNLVNTVMLQSTQNRYMLAIQQVINAEEAAKIEALTSAKNAAELAVQMGKAQNVLNAATGSVLLGNEARTKALRGAIKTLADEGITGFIDAGGHHWTPEAYVNMDIRTTVGNVARQAQKARAAEYGVDTFQVSSHAAARPLCAPYQGWICSWSGGGYTVEDLYGNSYMVHDIKETSYGEPAGLFGINCGHNPLTFVPGYSVPRVAELTPEQEQENALQYAQSQQQRHLEREVRQAKTEALAYEAAGDKEGFALAAAKVKQTQADYMAFCNATDRTPRTDRLQVFGYNRSVSGKATAATKGFTPTQKPVKPVKPAPIIKPAIPVPPVVPVAPAPPAPAPKKEYMTQAKLKQAIADIELQQAGGNTDAALQAEKEKLQIEYSKKYAASQKKKLQKQIAQIDKDMAAFDTSKTYPGIWANQDNITIADYGAKSSSVAAKKKYFENKILTLPANDPNMQKFFDLAKEVDEFNQQGSKYYALEQQKAALAKEIAKLGAKDYNYFAQNSPQAVYSEARKQAALWANTTKEADTLLRPKSGEVWRGLSDYEKDSIFGYTQSYNKINEPLRGYVYGTNQYVGPGKVDLDDVGVSYRGFKRGEVRKQMDAMYDVIDKSTYNFDFWTTRGTGYRGMDKFFDVPDALLRSGTQAELEAALLDKEITEYGFMSMGVARGTGFSGDIKMRIFVPSGTKVMYLEPFSAFGNGSGRAWDGIAAQSSFGTESEALLQNGTHFRVASVKRNGSQLEVTLEVIGQDGVRP